MPNEPEPDEEIYGLHKALADADKNLRDAMAQNEELRMVNRVFLRALAETDRQITELKFENQRLFDMVRQRDEFLSSFMRS